MQLFGLVNTLLSTDRDTSNYDLGIQRYSVVCSAATLPAHRSPVPRPHRPSPSASSLYPPWAMWQVPLATNSGLISWVAQCDTLHALIKEYREARSLPY